MIHQLLVVLALLLYALSGHHYVRVWQSDLTLWRYAVERAPRKPRPAVNYGLALIRAGQYEAATTWLFRARTLAKQAHVPAWDQRETITETDRELIVAALLSGQAK